MVEGESGQAGGGSSPPPRVVRKLAASVSVGAVAYLITNIVVDHVGEKQIWVITLSLLLGAVVFLTQFLYDADRRMNAVESSEARHAASVEKVVDDRLSAIGEQVKAGFNKINEVTELFGLVEESAMRTDAMTQLVRHATRISPEAPTLIQRFAQAEISRVSDFLKDLSEGGDVTYEGEDRDWMLALARSATSTIDATSLNTVDARGIGFVDGGLWASDLGQRYLEVQREAIQHRNVQVRRVFIMDRANLASDPKFMEICKLQLDLGIEVRVLDTTAIPSTRKSSLFDFILFDGVVSYESTPASNIDNSVRPAIINTRLELRSRRVEDRIERFKDLWQSARPVE